MERRILCNAALVSLACTIEESGIAAADSDFSEKQEKNNQLMPSWRNATPWRRDIH